MFVRAQADKGANNVRGQAPGDSLFDMFSVYPIATVGSGVWLAAAMLSGIIERTGPVGAYADTPDTADNIVAACPEISVGDSFVFTVRNTVAQANTVAVSTGVELSGANTAIAASLVRDYLLTCLANGRQQQYGALGTTNGSPTITGATQAQIDLINAGMGVSGTGITAGTTVIGVNAAAGTITLSANATATGSAALTFFPRFTLKGIRSSTL